jgi:hypothetical protein
MEVRAVLLTASLTDSDREALEAGGVEVRKPASKRIAGLYEAALEIRKVHPRLPLIVSASERVLRKFERRYPPLIDIALPNATATSVLAAVPS